MDEQWTLTELVGEVAHRIAALPAPRNGQVRAVPDERTIRYYQTIGLLDRPSAMRGRTALYGRKHAAQVVAIKRLQTTGRSLSEIQTLWPTLDDQTLARMSGVHLAPRGKAPARQEFWKRAPAAEPIESAPAPAEAAARPSAHLPDRDPPGLEVRVELAPDVVLVLSIRDESLAISPADIRAIRAAAAPLVAELASRRLTTHPGREEP